MLNIFPVLPGYPKPFKEYRNTLKALRDNNLIKALTSVRSTIRTRSGLAPVRIEPCQSKKKSGSPERLFQITNIYNY
jgi:hypothetical protein